MKTFFLGAGVAAILAALSPHPGQAASAVEAEITKCGACHQMRGPALKDIAARKERKAPPLFYAGNKFRQDWLTEWLAKPTVIRPAGDFPPAHIRTSDKGDLVDPASLIRHPALEPKLAAEMAAYLMSLKENSALVAKETYQAGQISERLGAMNFVKFQGCAACHKDTQKYGGVSGPELYTAWQRLRPEFIASYICDPHAWEPRSLMPNKHLNDPAIKKLADYLRTIGTKAGKTP